jgi:hypothetical protein
MMYLGVSNAYIFFLSLVLDADYTTIANWTAQHEFVSSFLYQEKIIQLMLFFADIIDWNIKQWFDLTWAIVTLDGNLLANFSLLSWIFQLKTLIEKFNWWKQHKSKQEIHAATL